MWNLNGYAPYVGTEASHDDLETLFLLSPDLLCIAGKDGCFQRVNPAFEQTLGYSADELVSRPYVEFVHPDDRQNTEQERRMLAAGCGTDFFENRYLARDGSVHWFSWRAVPQSDGRVFAFARDVTDRKAAEEAFWTSQQRYRRLLEAVTTYTYSVEFADGVAQATFHSDGCVTATGYWPSDFLSDPYLWILMVPPEDRSQVLAEVARIHQGQDVPPLEHRIIHRDGSIRWIRTTMVLHRDTCGKLLRYDGIVEDITPRKRAEVRFRRLLESAPDAMVIVDREGTIGLINVQAERILGYGREELVGRPVEMLIPEELRDSHREHWHQFALAPESRGMRNRSELSAVRKDGTVFPAEVSLAPIETEEGLLISYAIRDLTERKRMEGVLREQEAQLVAAERIQQHLLPHSPPDLPGFDVAGSMHPADFAAGDSFDYLVMSDGSIGMVVGDVAGHGFSAALLMASTHAYLRSLAETGCDPGELLTRTNRLLAQEVEGARFVTMFFARLEPESRKLTHVNAGHPAGYVLDSLGEVRAKLASTNVPLAVFPDTQYHSAESTILDPGDLVLLITDGVVEARSPTGSVLGIERVLDVIRRNRHQPAAGINQALYWEVQAHCGPRKHRDDVTSVVIKVTDRV